MVLFCISEYCSVKSLLEEVFKTEVPFLTFSLLGKFFLDFGVPVWPETMSYGELLPLLSWRTLLLRTLAFSFAHWLLICTFGFCFLPFSFVGSLIRPSATNRFFSSFHNIGLEDIAPILANGRINVNTYLKNIFALLFHRACVRNSLPKDSSLIRDWFLFLEPLSLTVW